MSFKVRELVAEAEAEGAKIDGRDAALALVAEPEFDDMAKQAFKDACDVNKIIKKAQRTGSLAHVEKYPESVYGEFENVDLLGAFERDQRAKELFADLPSEVRAEFNHDPYSFFDFATQPANINKLAELIPEIAEPGSYFPNPVKAGGVGAGMATAPVAKESPPEAPQAPLEAPGEPDPSTST